MQPEPCLKNRCMSPVACGGFGYCRERNFTDEVTTEEHIKERRKIVEERMQKDENPLG